MLEREAIEVFVTGATGRQGGAVVRSLLGRGHRVRALTRKPYSATARSLSAIGAMIVEGDFDRPDELRRAMEGSEAVFAMSTPYEAGPDVETRHACAIADAAKAAGVDHFIYTSVASADRRTGIPHFESKARVEQYIATLGLPFSVIRPVFFMENFLGPWMKPGLAKGMLMMALPKDRKLQQIAVADIGAFAAHMIENRTTFLGRAIDIASDAVSGKETADILSRAMGRKITYVEVPIEEVRTTSEDVAKMYEWFDRVGYDVDISALRSDYPNIGWHTLRQWATEQQFRELTPPELSPEL